MEEMIGLRVALMVEADPAMTGETAREIMSETLPTLKRWKQ